MTRILLTTDLCGKLRKVNQSSLVLHGENGIITDRGAARWMSQQLPNSELITLFHCGHALFLSHPDEFVASIVQLLHKSIK